MKNRLATVAFSALVALSAAALALPASAADSTPAKEAGVVHNPVPKHHAHHAKKHAAPAAQPGSAQGAATPSK